MVALTASMSFLLLAFDLMVHIFYLVNLTSSIIYAIKMQYETCQVSLNQLAHLYAS